MITANTLRDEYLEYINNYLTIELFAEHRNLSIYEANIIIDLGRTVHEQHVNKIRCLF